MIGIISPSAMGQGKFEKEWKQVQDYVDRSLPRSAMQVVDSIYLVSKSENDPVQFLKAALYQIKLRADYQENFMEPSIGQLEEEAELAVPPVRQVLHSILGELYWRYYQGNRMKILDRSATVAVIDPEDISTWDLRTLVDVTSRHYLASLQDAPLLQEAALKGYDPILQTVTDSKAFRPTLYDFLAHRALDFFMNDESSLTRPADAFELDEPGFFLPASDFFSMEMKAPEPLSMKYHAIDIFQDILAFHLGDSDPKALIDADLKRLQYVWNNSILPDKQELYIGALKNLQQNYASHPSSSEVTYELATVYSIRGGRYDAFTNEQYRWDLQTARDLCQEAIRRFPEADGAKNCQRLLDQLTEKELQITLRQASLPSEPFLASLRYKNLDRVYFRTVRLDPDENRNIRQGNRDEDIIGKYLNMSYQEAWEQSLPDPGDLQQHHVQLRMPPLPHGFYAVLASASASFEYGSSPIVYATFWSTEISYTSNRTFDGNTELFVLHRETGKPLSGVQATTFVREYDYSTRSYVVKEQNNYTTGRDGHLTLTGDMERSRSFYVKFTRGDDHYFTENYFYQYGEQPEPKPQDITYFFTDRAIYRPGQTVYFKGIMLEKKGKEHSLRTGESSLVALYDVNNQKVSEVLLTTNEFGSFHGSFTAPSGVLTGMMQIRNESGRIALQVEEYKRPRFRVKIEPLEGNYRLEETVNVTGKAMAYAGNPIDGAQVRYRVVRETRFPWDPWRYIHWERGETMEITNGVTVTDAEGTFRLDFPAIPDRSVDPGKNPAFHYTIHVDVTDINGETHSSEETVTVSDKALYISTDIPAELNIQGKNLFTLSTKNLNGLPVVASGAVNVYPLVHPGHVLRERSWSRPDVFVMDEKSFRKDFPHEIYAAEDDPANWQKEKAKYSTPFDTGNDSIIELPGLSGWEPGTYLLEIESTDAFGKRVTFSQYLTAFDPASRVMPVPEPVFTHVVGQGAEPGETVSFLFGTAEKDAHVLFEVVNKDVLVSRQWLEVDREMTAMPIPVKEEYRGNFSVRLMFVRGNRSHSVQEFITVPYTNKELEIRMETFRDKLTPGQEEEWRIRIKGKMGDQVAAELLASMYDASLNVFAENTWSLDLYPYFRSGPSWNANDAFSTIMGRGSSRMLRPYDMPAVREYDHLNWFGFNYYGHPGLFRDRMTMDMRVPGMAKSMAADERMVVEEAGQEEQAAKGEPETSETQEKEPADVPVRRNFEETAFFFPGMKTDESGDVLLKFKVPESLTAWKFMGLAHTPDLKTGYIEEEIVTRKELMVMPNPPRFFREGDRLVFSAKVVSMSDQVLEGTVTADFFDAFTMKNINDILGNEGNARSFSIEEGRSQSFDWEIVIPEGLEAIVYRVVAVSESFSDGEEMAIPVLPNRMLVTETLPLPVRGEGTERFIMEKLVNSGSSKTIRDHSLTLEFTSNPAWYAVQALPYLMEGEDESAGALFRRLYANSLASWIANSSPKIRKVFESWRDISPDALLSNLQKNEDLKSVILQETPWVMQAIGESEQKKRIALLFDLNRMANEQFTAASRLMQMQLPNGGWPWFNGMKDSPFITQNIISGIGKLQHLGVIDLNKDVVSMNMVRRGVYYMDQRMQEAYEKLTKSGKDDPGKDHLAPLYVQYLYGRSYFMESVPLNRQYEEAFGYFRGQAEQYWLARNKYLQGMIALALHRLGDSETAGEITRSLKEHALYSDELGMYWRETAGYFWHELPIERQAMLIEAFTEVTGDMESVEKMKVWLLKQKQTQMWPTGKATAEAVYALLLRGTDLLASDQVVEVTMGDEKIDPFRRDDVTVEAGTGYFRTSWAGESVKPAMGRVSVVKKDEGVAWGALYWQYFEDLDKISAARTPLALEKKLFREDNTPEGPVLSPVEDERGLKTGDKVVVRIVLRVDRDMEFVHMKDMRAAAFEPVNFLSGYRYQGGLGYYEAPKDASMNFYFDYLNKGTYVFEYALLATQEGEFSNGIATIQCQYAPEFSAHSEGVRVIVK